jgi:lipopolysaccharide transport system permease protein
MTRSIVISPPSRWGALNLAELWQYRELLLTLIARELQLRYAQTWVGIAWVVLKPLSTMLLLWVMFGTVAALPTDGIPYPLFFSSSLVLWFFFAGAITDSKDSLVVNADLIRKVYFPRPLLAIATTLARLVDLVIMLVGLAALLVYYDLERSPSIAALIAMMALTAVLGIGVGLCVAAVNVKYRDTQHVVPVALQLLLFASPVIYSMHIVPAAWRPIYILNPLAGLIEGFRAALVGRPLPQPAVWVATAVTFVIVVGAFAAFRRMETEFADYV